MSKKRQIGSFSGLAKKRVFSHLLLEWNRRENRREMPWKGEKDPYKIWLSEIILQQTRVEQGLTYYNRFVTTYPDVFRLARAGDAEVFRLWEGLGYYSRCRNLLVTARTVANELGGKFPGSYGELLKLKGIGPYTAAAIASFAFELPYAVVDGNVFRVISRVFGISKAVDTEEGKKYFTQLANELLAVKSPGVYNQAIMDFGATTCKPKPICCNCPFQNICIAFLNKRTNQYPVKEKKQQVKERWFNYLVLTHRGRIAIQQRNGKDIWQHLYEFPMIETSRKPGMTVLLNQYERNGWLKKNQPGNILFKSARQQLSHQRIHASFTSLRLQVRPRTGGWIWVKPGSLGEYSFPRLLRIYIDTVIKG